MLTTIRVRTEGWVGRRESHLRDLIRLVPSSFAIKIVGGAAAFGLNVLLARMVGASGAGTYQLAFTVTAIGSIVARLGLDAGAMRLAAELADRGRWERLRGVYLRGMGLSAAASGAVTLAVVASAPFLARTVFSDPALTGPLRIMALSIPPLACANVLVGFLRGVKRAISASAVETLIVPAIALAGTAFAARRYGVPGAAVASLVAAIAAYAYASRVWRLIPAGDGVPEHPATRELLELGLPLFWVASMNLLMQFADVLMVGGILGNAAVGVYAAALRTATLTNAFLSAVTGVVAPQFAALWAAGDRRGVERVARHSSMLMTAVSAPVLVLLLVAPGPVMRVFGGDFGSGASALQIIAVGQFLQTALGSVGYLLAMTGFQRDLRTIMLASAALFVGLNAALITTMGITGAALSYAATLVAMNVVKALVVYRRTGIVALPIPGRSGAVA